MSKTYSLKPGQVTRQWYLIDASELPFGRLSTRIAQLLIGKAKPSYTPHIDGGDFVVVINADKLVIKGNGKRIKKIYYRHTNYPGGLKQETLQEKLDEDSSKVIIAAVKGMLPKNKLQSDRLHRLKVYRGSEHPHQPQMPQTLNLKEEK